MRTKAALITAAMVVFGAIDICGATPEEFAKLETAKGRVYEKVKVTKVEPDGISIIHESGTAKIQFEHLSSELQKEFGYDSDAASEHRKVQAEKDRSNEEAIMLEIETAKASKVPEKMEPAAREGRRNPQASNQPNLPEIASVSMRAQTGSAGRNETKSWETSYGSFNKTVDQNRALQISLRNATDTDGTVTLEVIWLTNGADGKGAPSGISGVSRQKVSLRARQESVVTASRSFSRDHDKYVALGVSFRSGSGYAGWVARAVQPSTGKILGIVATREPLKRWSDKVPVLKD